MQDRLNFVVIGEDWTGGREQLELELPDEYRTFLREIGNGGMLPGLHCDFIIRPLSELRGGQNAATPFPVTAKRLRAQMRQCPAEGALFPELEPYWERS